MNPQKHELTSGQVAALFRVAPRTVSKWFDAGHFPNGWRMPGSNDRRIPADDVVVFCKKFGRAVPPQLVVIGTTVLLAGLKPDEAGLASRTLHPAVVHVTDCPVEAGVVIGQHRPAMVVVSNYGMHHHTNAVLRAATRFETIIRVFIHPEDRTVEVNLLADHNLYRGGDPLGMMFDLRKALETRPFRLPNPTLKESENGCASPTD